MNYRYEWGVFLTRAQPPTIGHMESIRQILSECSKVLVIVGSANKEGTLRNPFGIGLRMEMMREMIVETFARDAERVLLRQLDDLTYENNTDPNNDPLWGEYLYQTVVGWIHQTKFAYYSGELVDQSVHWFRDRLYTDVAPVAINTRGIPSCLSATSVREAIRKKDRGYVRVYCPASVYRKFGLLREILLQVLAGPKDDFSAKERGQNV